MEMLARKYTPPAWLQGCWLARVYELQGSWLCEVDQTDAQSQSLDGIPSAEAVDRLMEFLLTDSA